MGQNVAMISRRRSLPAAAIAGALVLAACGGGSSGSDGAAPGSAAPLPTPAVAEDADSGDVFNEAEGESTVAADPVAAEPVAAEPVAAEPEAEPAGDEVVEEPAPESGDVEPAPEPESAPAPAPAPAEIGGRALAADVQAAANFDGNPFPDLVVNDIGRDGEVNLRNILPSDRPVLLWSWAPH